MISKIYQAYCANGVFYLYTPGIDLSKVKGYGALQTLTLQTLAMTIG